MLDIERDDRAGFLEITVNGRIDRDHFEQAIEAIDEMVQSHDKLNIVEVVHDIGWIEPQLWWKDLLFGFTHLNAFNRIAVVSDSGWIGPLTRFFSPLYPMAIRTFGEDELEEARRWAREGDDAAEAA